MKVILYSPSIHTGGGTERVLINLANELTNRGFIIEIFSQKIGEKIFYDLNESIKVKQLLYDKIAQRFNHLLLFRVFNKIFGGLFLQIELNRTLKSELTAIITFSNSIAISCFRTSFRIKLIAFEHWPYWKVKKNKKLKYEIDTIYPKLFKVVVLTNRDKKNYELIGCNVVVIPNAYTYFPEIQSNLTSKNVLSIGHFNDQKRRDLLIESWQYVNNQYPDWMLTIIGDGKLEAECLQQINKLNLQNSIKIIKPNKEIGSYYFNSSIFLLSSEFEALPLVLMEAKTFGIPCVSFDVETGPNEVIRDNIDGYLVPFPDCQRFAEKTIQLIENIDLRKEMGNLARIDAKSKFDPIEIYNKWDELLNQLPK